ncbi:hypothetical protein AB0942_09550 [Streptomyces nodosus]|uniref:hypothetical protein n=1 Tax=Streptomyces nodosus TaxID=40318 RepID=UPI0034563DCB
MQVALWLRLSDTEVPCDDPGCAAREMYLTSDGSDSVPASGPLPAFARREGLGYFEYRTHPHHDGWACDVDPVAVQWMSTALALYGGYMRQLVRHGRLGAELLSGRPFDVDAASQHVGSLFVASLDL